MGHIGPMRRASFHGSDSIGAGLKVNAVAIVYAPACARDADIVSVPRMSNSLPR